MTQTLGLRNLAVASAFALTASLAMFAQAGGADAKNILNCRGDTRDAVLECCNEIVERKGLPIWMIQTGQNCNSMATRCAKKGSTITAATVNRCYYIGYQEDGSTDTKRPSKGRPQTHGKN